MVNPVVEGLVKFKRVQVSVWPPVGIAVTEKHAVGKAIGKLTLVLPLPVDTDPHCKIKPPGNFW